LLFFDIPFHVITHIKLYYSVFCSISRLLCRMLHTKIIYFHFDKFNYFVT